MKYLKLRDGGNMPIVGLGLSIFPEDPSMVEQMLNLALPLGYRHFDTAPLYRTELHLGNALASCLKKHELKIKREDLFIVTKLPQTGMRADLVETFVTKSLKDLQMDYIDLYLIHWPIGMVFQGENVRFSAFDMNTNLEEIWKAMEVQVKSGKIKSIGLSNFNSEQIERIIKIAEIPPANLQIEMHAYFQQKELRETCKKHGITIVAYYPLGGQSRKDYPPAWQITKAVPLLDDPIIKEIAQRNGKSRAQVLLKFLTQLDIAVIPKSSNPNRLAENFQILDFELSAQDISKIEKLDKGEMARSCFGLPGCETHPEYPFNNKEQMIYS